ncbi:MAG: peptide chain release factor N(5)-glutamine methyltransferase [Chloroflexota bacterium]
MQAKQTPPAKADSSPTVGGMLALARQRTPVSPTTAQALLAYVVGRGRAWLLAHPEAPLSGAQAAQFAALLGRAAAGEPLAYLVGEREFCGLTFEVTPDALIPRPESEALVEAGLAWARERSKSDPAIVDVGTGSGAIAVTLAARLPQARIAAVELSAPALAVARRNAQRHAVADRVGLVRGDLLAALVGPFDLILANLPYVSTGELAGLEVGRWEPRLALDGGADGLDLVRRLLEQAPARLAPGGRLALEIGAEQGERVMTLCREAFPQAAVRLERDLAGLNRIALVDRR